MPSFSKSLSISLAAVLTLMTGLSVTMLLFVAVSALEYGKMELDFQQRAGQRAGAIRRGLDDVVEVVTLTNDLFKSMNGVSRAQFRSFTRPLLQRYPFIQAFNYHRVVSAAERAAFEAELRRDYPGYLLHDMSDGKPVAAPARARHVVVDYLEPLRSNEAAFGLDVSALPMHAAIQAAVANGQVTATPLMRLAQERGNQKGFVLLMPVYRNGAPTATPDQRRAAWIGNTGAVIRSTDLIAKTLHAAALLDDNQLVVRVYTGDDVQPDNLIYSQGQPAPQAAASKPLQRWLAFNYHELYTHTFTAAGKPWHVQVMPLPQPFLANHLGSFSTLIGGALFTLLTAAFVQTLAQRSRRVQLLVDERTRDLQRSNELLNEDVAARKRTEQALQESEHRFRRLLALSSDWYWEQDAEFRFTNISGAFFEKGHFDPLRFIGRTRWEVHPDMLDARWGRDHIAQLEAHLPFSNFEYALAGADGVTRWFSTSGEPVFDSQGGFRGYRGTGTEITERKLSEQRIHHIAHHDVLTGLPNRVLLQDRLTQAAAFANRSGHPLWVMLIDLDRFKFVNDSLGHKAGDQLLKTIAQRLQDSVRESDTVARLSGDEFVAILSEYPDAPLSLDATQRIMRAVAQPVPLEGKEFFVTCSIGVAVYTPDGTPAQSLIEHADIAMYRAKKMGRNNTQFYQPAMNEEALERVRIESALRNALERQEFVLHYQPQLDLGSGRIVGMEALIRWQHPELGMVAPHRFIGLAEETGLIVPIGAWVLRTACAQAKAWQDAGHGALRVAVNLSPRQFGEPKLVSEIAAVLAETGLPPACLDIELTEGLFMHDVALAVELLHKLKGLGVALSIDDFGTGYSSFSYLRKFPINVLKIDRSFVSDIRRDDEAAIVVSIIALAHNLKLRVIAEGVESDEQLDYLRRNGCDEMQGYLFSPPIGAAAFEAMLDSGKTLALATACA
jgi:diguanylate cyclase (GGDEF)-like protein/PAS domain S-box-containing protein